MFFDNNIPANVSKEGGRIRWSEKDEKKKKIIHSQTEYHLGTQLE